MTTIRPQWEYMTMRYGVMRDSKPILEELNDMGLEGWELVAVVPVVSPFFNTNEYVDCVFKRQRGWRRQDAVMGNYYEG